MALVNSSKVNVGLPQLPDNVPPEQFGYFQPLYTALHNLGKQLAQYAGVDEYPSDWWDQLSLDDTVYAGGMNRVYVPQGEALTYGNCVNLYSNAGVLTARKANATNNTKFACGFVSSFDHVSSVGEFCEITLANGMLTGVGSLTVGSRYFLSTVDGIITNVAPVAAGNIEQVVGFALAANRLYMNLGFDWIQH